MRIEQLIAFDKVVQHSSFTKAANELYTTQPSVSKMIDALEELLRKIRPYELEKGSADRAFDQAMAAVTEGMAKGGIHGAAKGFKKAIEIMKRPKYDRSRLRPRVLIVGEYLLNFHPGANHDIEDYLEKNGFEIVEARMTDVIQKTYFYQDRQVKEQHVNRPVGKKLFYATADHIFDMAHNMTDRIAAHHPLYEKAARIQELAANHALDVVRRYLTGLPIG